MLFPYFVISSVVRQSFGILFGKIESMFNKKFEGARLHDVVLRAEDHDVKRLNVVVDAGHFTARGNQAEGRQTQ